MKLLSLLLAQQFVGQKVKIDFDENKNPREMNEIDFWGSPIT